MKRVIAFFLSLVMLTMVAVVLTSADDTKKLDMRVLEEYGQLHFYLGEPVARENAPNVLNASVSEGEYTLSYEYKQGDKHAVLSDKAASATFIDNEWVRFYLSYDEDKLYAAIETKDPNYIKGKDGMAFNLGFRDKGRPLDAISRYCFDMYAHANAESDDITTLTTKCRIFNKKDNGDWDNPPATDGMLYISGASMRHDDTTDITTLEVAFDIYFLAKEMGNELDLKDMRVYLFPFVYMYGESVRGKGDVVNQGVLWCYLKSDYIASLKTQFAKDYPEATYWSSIVPNIIHFCSDPATANESATAVTTMADATTVAVTTAEITKNDANTNAVTTVASGGCSSSLALLPLAGIPAFSVVLIKIKREEE